MQASSLPACSKYTRMHKATKRADTLQSSTWKSSAEGSGCQCLRCKGGLWQVKLRLALRTSTPARSGRACLVGLASWAFTALKVCTAPWAPTHTHTHSYVHSHIHLHTYAYLYTYTYTYTYTDTYTHKHTHTCTCIHTHVVCIRS